MHDCVIAEAQGSCALAITANYSGKKRKETKAMQKGSNFSFTDLKDKSILSARGQASLKHFAFYVNVMWVQQAGLILDELLQFWKGYYCFVKPVNH